MENKRELISVKQAAQILNHSPAAIYKAIHDGRLHYADPVLRKLDRKNIKQHFSRSTRPRIDKQMPSSTPVEQRPIQPDQWEEIAAAANELMDPEAWSTPPPWPADRWAGLCGVIDLARADVAS